MKKVTSLFMLGAALLLSASAGYAAPSSVAKSCKADVKKLCADAKPGGITACVNEHFKDLSADCQVAIIRSRGGWQGLPSRRQIVLRRCEAQSGGSGMPEGPCRRP